MISDDELVRRAHGNIEANLTVTNWYRQNEIRDSYSLYQGSQWLEEDYTRQIANSMPARTINRTQTVIDSVAGFEIQNRSEIKVVPRIVSEEQQGFADLANDGIKWIEDSSGYGTAKSQAFTDMLISGLGFVEEYICYDENPDGEVVSERIFPYFMIWDPTVRDKNMKSADWLCRAKIVDKLQLAQYLKKNNPEDLEADDIDFGASIDARFLDFFDTILSATELGVIYQYQWREKEAYYRIENPLKGYEGDPSDPIVSMVVEMARVIQDKYKFNAFDDATIDVPVKDLKELKELFASVGFDDVKATKQKKWKYYKADIIGDKVFNKAENYSQSCFSIQVMTGKYDELRQCYYGLARSMKEPQRLLNQAVSDMEGFLRTIPKGGIMMEAGAVDDMEGFRDTYLKAAQVTVFADGAITGGKVMPKPAPPMPDGLLAMVDMANRMIMDVVGITPDFMGMADSKLMTAQLNAQLVRQGLMVLAPYFDAMREFTKQTGTLFMDALRVLLENSEGRLIRHITPEGSAKYVPMLSDNIADKYDVVIEDVPMTPDQKQQTFEKLIELQSILSARPMPIDIMPIAMEYAPLKLEETGAIKTMLQPPPPPEPDPIQQGLLQAEMMARQADAKKSMAEADKAEMDVMLKRKELEYADKAMASDIIKTQTAAELDMAKAHKEQISSFQQGAAY